MLTSSLDSPVIASFSFGMCTALLCMCFQNLQRFSRKSVDYVKFSTNILIKKCYLHIQHGNTIRNQSTQFNIDNRTVSNEKICRRPCC